jgi:hypothetical protein
MAWWEVDFNYWLIRLMALFGLARDIKVMRPKEANKWEMTEPTAVRFVVQHNTDR